MLSFFPSEACEEEEEEEEQMGLMGCSVQKTEEGERVRESFKRFRGERACVHRMNGVAL